METFAALQEKKKHNGDLTKTQQQISFPQLPAASWVSKEVFDISLSLFRDATEKKPSSSMFEQVEKKNPSCPAMVSKPADDARTVSNKTTAVTDEQAAAFPSLHNAAATADVRQKPEESPAKEEWALVVADQVSFEFQFKLGIGKKKKKLQQTKMIRDVSRRPFCRISACSIWTRISDPLATNPPNPEPSPSSLSSSSMLSILPIYPSKIFMLLYGQFVSL
ncbi:uncharacterized protein LOC125479907 isoform X2 [Pyrus x bretschneideri]|uniref:uncharacterized protein LOC125479907 isoform X2 n=1 Tax=Pyrus x bretschneideri TaxID=225117 RepID=UPI00202F1262|nr:uncharacterized protein LOC125479907 isoform X2 [Pyrus x bretschneideri]